jgi:uncharacterized membrane protein (UPF0136 family)
MNDFNLKVLWAYIALLLLGGLIGFLKAKSKVSLISSTVFAAVLIATTLPGILEPHMGMMVANVTLIVLLLVFAMRLGKTKKFMPSGLILVATVAALALLNLKLR